MIYIEITVLTLANIRHSHGICPTTQLSWLSLEWTDVYTSSGGRKNWCYVHNWCMYISTISSLLPPPLNDDVCSTCLEFIFIYIIQFYIYSIEVSATCKLHVYHDCIIVMYIKISGNVSQKCMYNNKKQLTSSFSLHINHPDILCHM